MRTTRRDELYCRVTALCFAIGALLMLIGGVYREDPLYLLSSGLQLVAWWIFATHANQIEAERENPRAGVAPTASAAR